MSNAGQGLNRRTGQGRAMTSQTFPKRDEDVSDLEALSLTREESRAVLERKFEILDDIDKKAMHSLRTAIILLGIVISAVGIVGTDGLKAFGFLPSLVAGLGSCSLLLSILGGIGIYTVSGVPDGISQSHQRDVLEHSFSESEWLFVLLVGYAEWIEAVRHATRRNAKFLFAVQLLLALGFILLAIAVALSIMTN